MMTSRNRPIRAFEDLPSLPNIGTAPPKTSEFRRFQATFTFREQFQPTRHHNGTD